MRILVVEDEEDMRNLLAEALTEELYSVDTVSTGAEADVEMAVMDYDLVILDWGIPPPSGLELLQSWRRRGIHLPVLMLTGRRDLADRVSGLDSGADDYLTKPFAIEELLARVRSLMRRRDKGLDRMQAGDVVVDRASREVTVAGESVPMTAKEFGVLEYLLSRKDEVVTRSDLSDHVWDHAFDAMSNTVDVIVYRVRKRIDGDREAKLLHTVTGVGYRLSSERQPAGH